MTILLINILKILLLHWLIVFNLVMRRKIKKFVNIGKPIFHNPHLKGIRG